MINQLESRILLEIEKQIGDFPDDEVYVIQLESIPIEKIPFAVKKRLEKFTSLQSLALNDCKLKTLENFPFLRSLIRLDLVANELTGKDLIFIKGSIYLQTLYLTANKIETIKELTICSNFLNNLLHLDLVCNPVALIPDYHEIVFNMFNNLKVLDSCNRKKDLFEDSLMNECVEKVGLHRFEKKKEEKKIVPIKKSTGILKGEKIIINNKKKEENAFNNKIMKDNISQNKKAFIRKNSKMEEETVLNNKKKINSAIKNKGGKLSLSFKRKNLNSGLVFPVSRISRKIRKEKVFKRVGKSASVYLTAVLEYLSSEVLEIAGNNCSFDKKKIITPKHISLAINKDEDLKKMIGDFILHQGGFQHLIKDKN